MKKSAIGILLLLVSAGIIYAAVNMNEANHSLDNVKTSMNNPWDSNGNGIIDVCDSLSEPSSPVDVDTNKPNHPLSQISTEPDLSVSVDEDGNGWPDVCENITLPAGSLEYTGTIFHLPSQITRTDTNDQSVDSDGNNWPDKGDCILSELQTDPNNCGSCGNVCPGGTPCYGGTCVDWLKWVMVSTIDLITCTPDSCPCIPDGVTSCNAQEGECITGDSCLEITALMEDCNESGKFRCVYIPRMIFTMYSPETCWVMIQECKGYPST